ncbi:MAG: HD domain-containing protein [Candidatus Saccharicenans sp.]|nr:HD domain-containing protein [Candidatus Saccharicenans sp.]MDI6849234.1 HD domain-containing protein [Candidatus Saccharicenans sp.]
MKKLKADFRHRQLFVQLFGADVYAVGGFVRDRLRGVPTEEVDLLVQGHPLEEIISKLQLCGKVDLVGKSFGVIKFTVDGRTYDLALPRKDEPSQAADGQQRGHKDFLIKADPYLPLEKDLERRDFRCNSLALRLSDGVLIDPFRGAEDIRNRIIRLTNPRAFPDDPLRVLRAARFAAVLEFSIDPDIYLIARNIDLKGLSVERVNEELFKVLLLSRRPSRGLQEMHRLGVLRQLFPELYRLTLSIQDSIFHPEKDEFGHHTVWAHSLLSVDQARAIADFTRLEPTRKLSLLLAALFHDTGKPATASWEYKKNRLVITNNGHDLLSEKIARKVFHRQKIFSWNGYNLRQMVPMLIRHHHRVSELWLNRKLVTKKAFNRLAADIKGEIELLVYLDAADRAGRRARIITGLDRQAQWLLKKFEELKINRETIKPLIMGRDLIKLGVSPGPGMGQLLKKLYRLQLDNHFETRAQGLKLARKLIQEKK